MWHYMLRLTRGITGDDYNAMAKSQGGGCKICGKTADKNNARLSVDHCHKTGKIRGLLCNQCNSGIGFFNDNPALVKSALEYLYATDGIPQDELQPIAAKFGLDVEPRKD